MSKEPRASASEAIRNSLFPNFRDLQLLTSNKLRREKSGERVGVRGQIGNPLRKQGPRASANGQTTAEALTLSKRNSSRISFALYPDFLATSDTFSKDFVFQQKKPHRMQSTRWGRNREEAKINTGATKNPRDINPVTGCASVLHS